MSEGFYPGYAQGSNEHRTQSARLGKGKGLGPLRQVNRGRLAEPRLSRSRTFDTAGKVSFWEVVRECLVELFQISVEDAGSLSLDRRELLDKAPAALRTIIYYHREPFDVARGLAASRPDGPTAIPATLEDPSTRAAYEQILARQGLSRPLADGGVHDLGRV